MPRFIVKLTDKKEKNKEWFLLWSTIVDGATRQFNGLEDATEYLKENLIPIEFIKGVRSLKTQGTSNPFYSIQDILDCNDEGCSTEEELIEKYVDKGIKKRNI